MNPSTNDECGTLIEGFDSPPYIMMRHNPEFYPTLIEGYGNTKAKDLYAQQSLNESPNKTNEEENKVEEA